MAAKIYFCAKARKYIKLHKNTYAMEQKSLKNTYAMKQKSLKNTYAMKQFYIFALLKL